LVLRGADANAGLSQGVDASNNKRWGIDEGSFLGSHHVGFQMENNELGPYTVTDNNAICEMNGYTEPGQPPAYLGPGALASGPQFAGITGPGTILRAAGLDGGGLMASNGFVVYPTTLDGRVGIGRDSFMDITPTGANTYRLKHEGGGIVSQIYANTSLVWSMYPTDGAMYINRLRMDTSAGHTLGSVVRRAPLYNGDGTFAGYVPVYDTIN
jgi:hypothetical protein